MGAARLLVEQETIGVVPGIWWVHALPLLAAAVNDAVNAMTSGDVWIADKSHGLVKSWAQGWEIGQLKKGLRQVPSAMRRQTFAQTTNTPAKTPSTWTGASPRCIRLVSW